MRVAARVADTAGVEPTPDDWDATSLLTGQMRDPPPPPRSYRRHLLGGFAALAVAMLLIVAAFRYVWPEPTGPTQEDGENRLTSIALPDTWQRSKIVYNHMFYDPTMTW